MVVLVDLRWWWRHGCGDVGDDVNGVEMVVGWCWRSGKGSGDGGCGRGGNGVWKWWVASDLWLVGWRAFTASANVPTIYALTQEAKSGVYSFQPDEQWFALNVDILRMAFEITPVDPSHPFVSPPAGEQPWRAILSLINQCLTGKTSGNDKPRHPVLQMLWGIVTITNVDYAELLWEEFV
ncbi:hypothetical protein Tco_0518235 [Tanacetum coccineum]